jgi:hypothetical protein
MLVREHLMLTFVALLFAASAASAREAKTASELAMRGAPSPSSELLLTMPAGASVSIGACARGWCKVTWNTYSGYKSERGLKLIKVAAAAPRPFQPLFPRYPYHAGHYPTADSYYELAPYADISPSWYRWRYFLTLREGGRYRYVPYVFTRQNYRAP